MRKVRFNDEKHKYTQVTQQFRTTAVRQTLPTLEIFRLLRILFLVLQYLNMQVEKTSESQMKCSNIKILQLLEIRSLYILRTAT